VAALAALPLAIAVAVAGVDTPAGGTAGAALADSVVSGSGLPDVASRDSVAQAAAPPDSQWAIGLGAFATLDEAAQHHAVISENGESGFVRIRAEWTHYRYELLAGPWSTRAAADSAAALRRGAGSASVVQVVGDRTEVLRAGVVLGSPPPAAAADPAAAVPADTTLAAEPR